jgi:hypothetical protein
MLVGWVVLVVVQLAENNLADTDLWWHLRNAQFLVTNYRFPNFDTYSFTVVGRPWMNHEWLGEIPFYLAWRVNSLEGIEILMLTVLAAIFLGVLYLCYLRSQHIKASALACWVAVLLGTVNFGSRTILFGYVCFVVLLIILERFRVQKKSPLWVLPILFCVWINAHGSWSLGLLVFAIFVLSGLVEGQWGNIKAIRWSPQQLRRLIMTFGTSCLALFANPFGRRLILFPLDLAFRQPLGVAAVEEWGSVDFHGPRGKVVLIVLAGLFLAALVTHHQWHFSDLLLTLFAFYCGLSHERFLFFAGIIVAPIIADLLQFVPRYRPEIDKHWLNAMMLFGMLAFAAHRFPTPEQLEFQVEAEYPAEALPHLDSPDLSGNMLNFYPWGGYLGWENPQLKVFIDSRANIYEHAGVFEDYLRLTALQDTLGLLDKYKIRWVLFPVRHPVSYLLGSNPNWKVVYSGGISTLFERAVPITTNASGAPAP